MPPLPLAYADRWCVRPGDRLGLKADGEGKATVDLVRLRGLVGSGVPTGYRFDAVESLGAIALTPQSVPMGSFAQVDAGPEVSLAENWVWHLSLLPTLTNDGTVLDWGGHLRIRLQAGRLVVEWPGAGLDVPVDAAAWSQIACGLQDGELRLTAQPLGPDAWHRRRASARCGATGRAVTGRLRMGQGMNGRIGGPRLMVGDEEAAAWHLGHDMTLQTVRGRGARAGALRLVNTPRRAVCGAAWTGRHHAWRHCPDDYDAVHFHTDDLADCLWPDSAEVLIPSGAPSGIYAARVASAAGVHHVPIFVRSEQPERLLFLAPTFSYLAYGNSLWASPSAPRIEAEWPRETAAMRRSGLSTYSRHPDGSGIGHVSMRRPILNATPGFLGEAIGGQVLLNDDLRILSWMDRCGEQHGVVTDHDLHAEGLEALRGCEVLVTGTHPEYLSRKVLDALEGFVQRGGRLIYMGGNGFYWRVAFMPEAPHVMELRRAEGGIRIWAEAPGEYCHQADGEPGGLWRRLGRTPNRLVGVGFSAQGDETPTRPYVRTEAAKSPRAAFLFDGVAEGPFGRPGPLGAAGGYEMDRADRALGTPPHALVVARTEAFDGGMVPVNEERLTHSLLDADDPVRADLCFFEGPNGGAVLATGSIPFAGSLNEMDGAGKLMDNALRRFLDAEPFELPPEGTAYGDS